MANPKKKPDIRLRNTLLSIVSLLKHKASDKNLEPVISVAKVIDMLRVAGLGTTYDQLAELTRDPAIQSSIASINKNQIRLNLGDEETIEEPDMGMDLTQEPEPTEEMEPEMPESEEGDEMNPEEFRAPAEAEQSEDVPLRSGSTSKGIVSSMARRAAGRAD